MLKLAVLKETYPFEERVAITPDLVKKYEALGFEVIIEAGAGLTSGIKDEEYISVGAKISKVPLEIASDADIVLKVRPSCATKERPLEHNIMQKDSIFIGLLDPHNNKETLLGFSQNHINCFSLEMMPRISRAQSMDVLSSQTNLAGYRAVIEAFYELTKVVPMMMTAAGTVTPAKVLVLGAGVAGLQAIATAKRMGAIVYAFDVRLAAKEQVESLGGKFIQVLAEGEKSGEAASGYAKEMSEDYQRKQEALIKETIRICDVVITTALIPGKKAPILVKDDMIAPMKPGSVIVDMAAASGGNVEGTKKDKITEIYGVKLIGYSNLASRVARDASRLYAKNLYNFVELLVGKEKRQIKIDKTDEIIKACLVTTDGKIFI